VRQQREKFILENLPEPGDVSKELESIKEKPISDEDAAVTPENQ